MATLLLTLGTAAAVTAAPADRRIPLPDGWQPEGIASGPGRSLYVGSIPTGAILRLDPRSGRTRTVVAGRDGRAAIGIEVDGRKLLAAGGETGKIFAYDRRTGKPRRSFDVGGIFVNDIARARGAYYVTDSRKAVLYRVKRDLSGVRTIRTPDIPVEPDNNLNGIEATGNGRHLIAVQSNTGRLWRIDPGSGDATAIDLGGAKLVNGDGLLLAGRTLLVVRNRNNRIAVVRLRRGFASGQVVGSLRRKEFDVPTTLAVQHGHLYAVNARFGTDDPESAEYWVTRVR